MKRKVILLVLLCLLVIISIIVYLGLSNGLTKSKYLAIIPDVNYYHGIILSGKGNPIDSLKVMSLKSNSFAYTDKKGYFQLKGKKIDVNKLDSLIFLKKEFIADTIATYSFFDDGYKYGEVYYFCQKKIDTIYVERANHH